MESIWRQLGTWNYSIQILLAIIRIISMFQDGLLLRSAIAISAKAIVGAWICIIPKIFLSLEILWKRIVCLESIFLVNVAWLGYGLHLFGVKGVVDTSIFRNNNGHLLYMLGSVLVWDCTFEDNDCEIYQCIYVGVYSWSIEWSTGNITGNAFLRNNGPQLIDYANIVGDYSQFWNNTVYNNTLNNPINNGLLAINGKLIVRYNRFDNPDTFHDVNVITPVGNPNIDLSRNWWSTTDEAYVKLVITKCHKLNNDHMFSENFRFLERWISNSWRVFALPLGSLQHKQFIRSSNSNTIYQTRWNCGRRNGKQHYNDSGWKSIYSHIDHRDSRRINSDYKCRSRHHCPSPIE